jgi:hypothetical protein
VQKIYKLFSDIENLADCTPAKVSERPKWNCIVNSAVNRQTLLTVSMGSRFLVLYTACTR